MTTQVFKCDRPEVPFIDNELIDLQAGNYEGLKIIIKTKNCSGVSCKLKKRTKISKDSIAAISSQIKLGLISHVGAQ
jgi:hypothetical protein